MSLAPAQLRAVSAVGTFPDCAAFAAALQAVAAAAGSPAAAVSGCALTTYAGALPPAAEGAAGGGGGGGGGDGKPFPWFIIVAVIGALVLLGLAVAAFLYKRNRKLVR